jgi:tetratricopeptide (TPR) repeat protein
MPLRVLVVALWLAIGVAVSGHVRAQSPAADDVRVWLEAVKSHDPGTLDEHAEAIGMWPWERLSPVLRALRDRLPAALGLRAAMLYLDVAVHVDLAERPRYPSDGSVLRVEDGRVLGPSGQDSQIWWARRILLLGGRPPRDDRAADFVAWYRGTTAMLAGDISLSDLEPHAYDALQAYPDAPGILFDVGCVAETFASVRVQAAVPAARGGTGGSVRRSGIARTLDGNLAEAEQHFRRAVERDPTFMEARVRLGRVLAERGRFGEARRELEAAAAMSGPPDVHYLADLFLGRALEHGRDLEAAERAYARAAARFPAAQSAALALSAVRMARGDVAGARAALGSLWKQRAGVVSNREDDPWWHYHRCAGRSSESIYRDLAGLVRGLPRE